MDNRQKTTFQISNAILKKFDKTRASQYKKGDATFGYRDGEYDLFITVEVKKDEVLNALRDGKDKPIDLTIAVRGARKAYEPKNGGPARFIHNLTCIYAKAASASSPAVNDPFGDNGKSDPLDDDLPF